jgi:hypothetical protein
MVRSGPCRPRRSRTRAWNGHGELLVSEDALLAKLPELFDLLVGFPARGPLGWCCGGRLKHLLVQFLVVMLVARHHHDQVIGGRGERVGGQRGGRPLGPSGRTKPSPMTPGVPGAVRYDMPARVGRTGSSSA